MPMRNFYIKNFKATNNCIFWFSILCNYFVQDMERGGGGDSAYERGGDARWQFWIKPLKETDLGVAQAFFDP